jgi:hypothetical protein
MEIPLHTETSRVLNLLQCCTRHSRDLEDAREERSEEIRR